MSATNKYPFPQGKPDDASFGLLHDWWHQLESDTGERAFLRRAESLTQVMLSAAFVDLLHTLRNRGYAIGAQNPPLARLAAIAGLVARIKAPSDAGLAQRMGTAKSGGQMPTVSELRVRRILACDDIEELYTLLRRALAILDHTANLTDLATVVWNWKSMDEKHPHDPRRRLAYDYYSAIPDQS